MKMKSIDLFWNEAWSADEQWERLGWLFFSFGGLRAAQPHGN